MSGKWADRPKDGDAFRVLIIGAGFSGIGLGCRLKATKSAADFLILEKGADLGGTWFWNEYPGAACDIVSHLYSYSWHPNPGWSSLYPSQQEILAYMHEVAQRHELAPHLRLNTEVVSARYLEDCCLWCVSTAEQDYYAQVVVSGVGGLHTPKYPEVAGRPTFGGRQFHTTRWDRTFNAAGKRLAVVGSGASAVQVVPELCKTAASVVVVQRTPNWFVPRPDAQYGERTRRLFAALPLLLLLLRWFYYLVNELTFFLVIRDPDSWTARLARRQLTNFIHASVPDAALAAKLVPSYAPGCKRILVTHHFFRALREPNVTLDTRPLAAVDGDGLVMADGGRHDVDAIVWATGFDVIAGFPLIYGRRGAELNAEWQGGDRIVTNLGISAPNYPNLFFLLGPSTALGHNSVVIMIEAQIEYVLQCVDYLARAGRPLAIEAKLDVAQRFQRWVASQVEGRVWVKGGCTSWYKTPSGNVYTVWPGTTWSYRWATRRPRIQRDFDVHQPAAIG